MTANTLEIELEDLSSAEEFLDYFQIAFDPSVVQVNRLHIMQRYHDYLETNKTQISDSNSQTDLTRLYRDLLERSYQDFVESDALTEKVFKVFRMHEPQTTFVSVDQLLEP
ncbi:nitrogenase-stabilizing/protective protein NifW [Teredinibacter haidensis]|uniref:nitrogenase-stabilizing/protective protein NifW n=1 Tax=Teredinibacter haidensis TaxID=2731755 RepID=UPI0009491DD2|nr:nitrogenase-stabilizing/protective protein NifW [Teredinibacter haidensis]